MEIQELLRMPRINRWSSSVLTIAALGICLNLSYAQNLDPEKNPKARLVETIKNWVAQQEGVDPTFIEVQANDRRFIVPDCNAEFTVAFAFSSKTNVQANCENENWQAVLRIQIREDREVLVYLRSLSQGDIISADDLETARDDSRARNNGLIDRSEVEGKILQVDVEKGQKASINQFAETLTIFITNQELKKGQRLEASMLSPLITPTSETVFEQRFDLSDTLNTTVIRDLAAGSVLTKNDFALSSPGVVVTALIERGNLIDPSNSRADALTLQLPNDAVANPSQLTRAIAKRRLTPGTVIRFSDITLQPHVSAEESITLELRRSQFTLTMEAYAVEDGYIGDRIRVRNQESGEVIYATVIDIGRVEITP